MDTLVLRVPYATPSLNALTNRRSRWAYRQMKTRWMRYLSDAYHYFVRFSDVKVVRGWARSNRGPHRLSANQQ